MSISVFIRFVFLMLLPLVLWSCERGPNYADSNNPLIITSAFHINTIGDLNSPNSAGFLPVIYAAYFNDTEALRFAIDKGANLNERGVAGYTAMHWAAAKNQQDALSYLLAYGANPDVQNDHGETALFLALKHGNFEIATQLLEYGASPFAITNYRQTAFSMYLDLPENMRRILLFESGIGSRELPIYRGMRSEERNRNLRVAATEGRTAEIPQLLASGSMLNARSAFGRTPLIFAVKNGHFDTVRELLSYQEIQPGLRDRYNKTAYDYAMELGYPYIAEFLGIAIRAHENR